jgi:hypothetical protein
MDWLSDLTSSGGLQEIDAREIDEGNVNIPTDQDITIPELSADTVDNSVSEPVVLAASANVSLMEYKSQAEEAQPPSHETRAPSISRPESSSSHQSKPDVWHPSNRPDPKYVYSM